MSDAAPSPTSETIAVPDHFVCPISLEMMQDPVICSDGNTYERREITRWLQTHDTSPKTNIELANKNLITNYAIKSGIEKFLTTTGMKRPKPIKTRSATANAPEEADKRMQVFVRLITNATIAVKVEKHATVLDLMKEVERVDGIKADQMRLIYAGKQMDPHKPLARYSVGAGSVVHLVLRLVGGRRV